MRKSLILLLCLLQFFCLPFVFGQKTAIHRRIISMGPGVHNIRYNAKGELISFIAVGCGRLRKSLPRHLALSQARNAARREARNEVAKFFNTSVKWVRSATNEMVCISNDAAANNKNEGSVEKLQYVEVSREKSRACFRIALSGLQQIVASIDDKNGTYGTIWRWQYKSIKGSINASKAMGDAVHTSANEANTVRQPVSGTNGQNLRGDNLPRTSAASTQNRKNLKTRLKTSE